MKKIRSISIFTLVLLISACNSTENEVKDMRDIIPTADGEYGKDTLSHETGVDSLAILQDEFAELGIIFDSINKVSTTLMADRFGHIDDVKYELIGGGQVLHIYRWTYKDSARVTNALFNWIDCFGPKRKSIQVGESKNLQKDAFHLYANNECMIFVESDHAIKTRSIEDYLASIDIKDDWNYILEQSRNGKVRWYQFVDDRKKTIKLEK